MKLDIFSKKSPLQEFAQYVGSNLGVRVVMRGREICAQMKPNPIVFVPCLKNARPDDVLMIKGFALHEAGHIAFTNFNALDHVTDKIWFRLVNTIEDNRIESRLESRLLGARDMLVFAQKQARILHFRKQGEELIPALPGDEGAEPMLDQWPATSFLPTSGLNELEALDKILSGLSDPSPAQEQWIRSMAPAVEFPPETLALAEQARIPKDPFSLLAAAKRLEVDRVMGLWLTHSRRYDKNPDPIFSHDLLTHPWYPAIAAIDAASDQRTTADCVRMALRLVHELRIPIMPEDHRPAAERNSARHQQKAAHEKTSHAAKELSQAVRSRDKEIRKETEKLRAERNEETMAAERRRNAEADVAVSRQSLDDARKDLQEAKKSLSEAKGVAKEARARGMKDEADRADAIIETRKGSVEQAKKVVETAKEALATSREAKRLARESLNEAKESFRQAKDAIVQEVTRRHAPVVDSRRNALDKCMSEESAAKEALRVLDEEIEAMDAPIRAPADKDRLLAMTRIAVNKDKGVTMDAELGSKGMQNFNGTFDPLLRVGFPVDTCRQYEPYSEEWDYDEVPARGDQEHSLYAQCVQRVQPAIDELVNRLRQLKSPLVTKQKFNVTQGRINPRHLVRVALAGRGMPLDVSRVWRTTEPKPDPQVCVQLLLDLSGSMKLEGRWDAARDAAVIVHEALSILNIPCEVLGHTTDNDLIPQIPFTEADIKEQSSRVAPLRRCLFKDFQGDDKPVGLFADFPMHDNLDGEAVLWAASRICERKEKKKLLLVLSDGYPEAPWSAHIELQRHLKMACLSLEQHEGRDLLIHGIGIQSDAVRLFYKNHSVVDDHKSLVDATCDAVCAALLKGQTVDA